MYFLHICIYSSLLLGIYPVASQSNDSDCECVPFYLCKNGTISTNGEGVIDIRAGPDQQCAYLETCCPKEDKTEEPITRSPPKEKVGCGVRNLDGVGFRIFGNEDNEAEFGEFPWTVAIMHKSNPDPKFSYKCGGSLIHPQVVLTAAHCIIGSKNLLVRAGEWDTKTTLENFKHQERNVSSGVVHRDFKKRNLENDVALLFLESPFDLSEQTPHINTVCLPPPGAIISAKECYVAGWGKSKFEADGVYQNILKKIDLPVIDRRKCEDSFKKTRLGRYFQLHRSFMCAGGEQGKDACTGDGGGPLVCPVDNKENVYQQVGIVAWGIGCGTEGVPGAYVDVAYFRDWIDRQMQKKKIDIVD